MPDRDEIERALRSHDADYLEVRLDDTATNRIVYRGRELEEKGRIRSFGGNVRALVRGGWGFVSFNEPSKLRKRVEEAVSAAHHVGRETSMLAEVPPVVDRVRLEAKKDPRAIPLATKKEMLDRYNERMLSVEGVTSTNIMYSDSHKQVVFASSEGSYIEQERIDVVSRLSATAGKNGDMQQANMSLGALVDGAAVPGLRGSFRYDDEGVPAQETDLIREGILVGRLHSRETAGKMGERLTGNARAIDYRFPPIVRMTNTYIEPGNMSFKELIADIDEGVYARNWFGGTTSMEMFTFSAGEAYMIRDGKIAELLRPVKLTGNLFTTLLNIDALGDDMSFPEAGRLVAGWNQGGACGKVGQ